MTASTGVLPWEMRLLLMKWNGHSPVAGACFALALSVACGGSPVGPKCSADSNGVSGGTDVIDLTVSDTAFTVGALDGGPGEPNVAIENAATVILTMTNVGSLPHDLRVQCQPTPNADGCPMQVCFPSEANLPEVQPGKSAATRFVAPFHEGLYPFVSDIPGDTQTSPDGGITGLVGQFVLM
jgi:hypothetical protein